MQRETRVILIGRVAHQVEPFVSSNSGAFRHTCTLVIHEALLDPFPRIARVLSCTEGIRKSDDRIGL